MRLGSYVVYALYFVLWCCYCYTIVVVVVMLLLPCCCFFHFCVGGVLCWSRGGGEREVVLEIVG